MEGRCTDEKKDDGIEEGVYCKEKKKKEGLRGNTV